MEIPHHHIFLFGLVLPGVSFLVQQIASVGASSSVFKWIKLTNLVNLKHASSEKKRCR